jgi:formate-dependent nitrite reductase membrane component NrfD
MQTRQWMITHKWMVEPMAQKEWIERKGLMVFIAETFTSLGAGLYLVSLLMNNWWGMVIGWLIIMFLKLPVHIAYLGKPLRFYRTLPPFSNAWKTSWFARGILFTVFFSGFAFVQLVVGQTDVASLIGTAATPLYYIFGVLGGIFALMTGIYGGLIMNCCKGIRFWNTWMLPAVFILAGIADGFALIIGIGLAGGGPDIATAEFWGRIVLMINLLLIAVYLVRANYSSAIAKISVKYLVKGNMAWVFWLGIIGVGIVVPFIVSFSSLFTGGASSVLLVTAIVCHTCGAFSLKYCLLKAGIHTPLVGETDATIESPNNGKYPVTNELELKSRKIISD